MSHPEEWFKTQAHKVKNLVDPDPEESRIKAEAKTEEQERDFRRQNYLENPRSNYRAKAGKVIQARPMSKRMIKSNRITLR